MFLFFLESRQLEWVQFWNELITWNKVGHNFETYIFFFILLVLQRLGFLRRQQRILFYLFTSSWSAQFCPRLLRPLHCSWNASRTSCLPFVATARHRQVSSAVFQLSFLSFCFTTCFMCVRGHPWDLWANPCSTMLLSVILLPACLLTCCQGFLRRNGALHFGALCVVVFITEITFSICPLNWVEESRQADLVVPSYVEWDVRAKLWEYWLGMGWSSLFGCLFLFFVFLFLFFWDRDSLCSPGCPGTHSVDQADLCLPSTGIKGARHHRPCFGLLLTSHLCKWYSSSWALGASPYRKRCLLAGHVFSPYVLTHRVWKVLFLDF
jgi:hypothetical protein